MNSIQSMSGLNSADPAMVVGGEALISKYPLEPD